MPHAPLTSGEKNADWVKKFERRGSFAEPRPRLAGAGETFTANLKLAAWNGRGRGDFENLGTRIGFTKCHGERARGNGTANTD